MKGVGTRKRAFLPRQFRLWDMAIFELTCNLLAGFAVARELSPCRHQPVGELKRSDAHWKCCWKGVKRGMMTPASAGS